MWALCVWYFLRTCLPVRISFIYSMILFSLFLLNTLFTVWSLLSTTRNSPSLSPVLRPLKMTEIFPLIRLNFWRPSRLMSSLRLDPYLYILYVSFGATLLNTGNQLESHVKLRSTLKSGMRSRTWKMASLFFSKNYCLIFWLELIKIFRIWRFFIAIAISLAFISSFNGLSFGHVYISLKILTASIFPSLTASINGVFPHGSSWFFSA